MKSYLKGTQRIMVLFIVLISLILLIPAAFGYGSTQITADTIGNGTYDETWLAGDYHAWYEIKCSEGDVLSISVTFDEAGDYDIIIWDPAYVQGNADSGDPTSSLQVSQTCDMSGYYSIEIYRSILDALPAVDFTLTVSGASEGIPGFERVSILIGLFMTIGLSFILLKNRGVDFE